MKTRVLFLCMALAAMMLGLASCEPIGNDRSPLIGQWMVEGDSSRTIEFDAEKATIITYDPSGEVYGKTYFEYIAKRKVLFFAMYTPNLELHVLECSYRFDGDNSVIINSLNVILYYGSSQEPPQGYESDVTLIRK